MEDMRELEFPPLITGLKDEDKDSKNMPTEEQLNAVDDLITAMDMSNADQLVFLLDNLF